MKITKKCRTMLIEKNKKIRVVVFFVFVFSILRILSSVNVAVQFDR